MAAELGAAVGPQRRTVERHERELRDRQPRVELDRDPREVVQLERQRALPARVAEAGRGVDDQPEAPERALALDPRDDVVGQLDPLERPPEAELARVDHERLVLAGDDHLLGQVLRRPPEVDRRGAVVVEDPERVAEPQVDARRLDQLADPTGRS